jgi:hypothetical protein
MPDPYAIKLKTVVVIETSATLTVIVMPGNDAAEFDAFDFHRRSAGIKPGHAFDCVYVTMVKMPVGQRNNISIFFDSRTDRVPSRRRVIGYIKVKERVGYDSRSFI